MKLKTKHKTKKTAAVVTDDVSKPKKRLNSLQLAMVAVLIGIAGVSALLLSFAATPVNIYLSPAAPSEQQGDTFVVALRANPNGTNTDAVSVTVTYDKTKLQLISADGSTSPYTVSLDQSTTANTINITRATGISGGHPDAPITTDSLVTNLTFKALVGTGTSALTLSNSQATYAGKNLTPTTTNATVTFSTPPPPTIGINNLTSASIVSTDLAIAAGDTNAELNSASYVVNVTAADKSGDGLATVSLQLDSQAVITHTAGSNSFSLNMAGLGCGTHTLVATVKDKAPTPKVGTATVSFKAAKSVDINGNCTVDLSDYNAVRSSYGMTSADLTTNHLDQRIDTDRDGIVQLNDYSAVRSTYGS